MALRVGVLDQSPVISGHAPAQALAETVALARLAEDLGYHRTNASQQDEHSQHPGLPRFPPIEGAKVTAGTGQESFVDDRPNLALSRETDPYWSP